MVKKIVKISIVIIIFYLTLVSANSYCGSSYSAISQSRLDSCDRQLRELFEEVIKYIDCSIFCGYRGKEEQDRAYFNKISQLKFPKSKHNIFPSKAVDVIPYPIEWENLNKIYYFAGIVKGIAIEKKIDIRWGGDWDGDNDLRDQSLYDLCHYELK